MSQRSSVWSHYTIIYDDNGVRKGKYKYFDKEFYCDPKKHGTTSLKNQLDNCKKHPYSIETKQTQLSLQPSVEGGDIGTLCYWKFDKKI